MNTPDPDSGFRVQYRGGPLDGRRETFERRPDAIGSGDDPASGYLQSQEIEDGWRIYQWVETEQEAERDATSGL